MIGYLQTCVGCGATIYLAADPLGVWRPFESGAPGSAEENDWVLHSCRGASAPTPTPATRPRPDPPLESSAGYLRAFDDWKRRIPYRDVPLSEAKFIVVGDVVHGDERTYGIIARTLDEVTAWRIKRVICAYEECDVDVRRNVAAVTDAVFAEVQRLADEQKEAPASRPEP